MSRDIYGVTVGTPYNPQKIVDKTLEQAKNDDDLATKKYVNSRIIEHIGDIETLLGGI